MTPEEKSRIKIDSKLGRAGWYIVNRDEYIPQTTSAIREALAQGNKESDYLLFVDNKAIAVIEAKKADNPLGSEVENQVENYARTPLPWYGLWEDGYIPLVYISNGEKILFKNLKTYEEEYNEIDDFHSPKEMLRMIGRSSEFGALPKLEKSSLRDCQYNAELEFEKNIRSGNRKNLAVLATGSGKTYFACLASYRLLNYTPTQRILFLVDRNNLARQTESEFSKFNLTENRREMNTLYDIKRLKHADDIKGDIVISTIQKLYSIMTGQSLTDEDEDAEDERLAEEEERNDPAAIRLGNDLTIPSDYFQFIIVDECHRSIYGRWRAVLDYFNKAIVLGLTATPTPEAYAFFDNNTIENYTYDRSVAMIGTIGNPVIIDTDKEFCIKNVALFKRYKGSDFNMNYLYYFLLMEQYEMRKITLGGLQPFVSLKLFRSHLVPLPPLAEQKRIAEVLERVVGVLG